MGTWMIARRAVALALVVLSGAAVAPVAAQSAAQSAAAPAYRLGDRWVYDVKAGIGLATTSYQETREVIAAGASGIKIRVTGKTVDGADLSRIEDYAAPGSLRAGAICADQVRRYPVPLQRLGFPLAPGKRSSKWVDVVADPGGVKGQINYGFRTRDWEKLTVPAGAFDALRVDVLMMLDDSTAFRDATRCNFTYWYAPAVRGTIRERRAAQYTQISGIHQTIPVLSATYELASFTPGKP